MFVFSADREKKIAYLPNGEKVEGVRFQTLATGSNLMITTMFYSKDAIVPVHSHPEEQAGYVSSGSVRVRIGDDEKRVVTGDSYVILGNIPHTIIAEEDSIVIDTFSPPRDSYRE